MRKQIQNISYLWPNQLSYIKVVLTVKMHPPTIQSVPSKSYLIHLLQTPAQSGTLRARCPGPYPCSFWTSPMSPLGSLCQCSITHTTQKCCLIFRGNFYYFILFLSAHGKQLKRTVTAVLSLLHSFLQVHINVNEIIPESLSLQVE